MTTLKVAAISGSLREGSFNSAALRACRELAPRDMRIDVLGISELPHYNGDFDGAKTPSIVVDFKASIREADAVLIVSPEYNYSIPGALKNALDWASRSSEGPQVFHEKPVAIMGASTGMLGTARMQYHLRQVFVFLNAYVLNRPEVMIAKAQDKFDAQGRLVDEPTRKAIEAQLQALAAWTRKLKDLG